MEKVVKFGNLFISMLVKFKPISCWSKHVPNDNSDEDGDGDSDVHGTGEDENDDDTDSDDLPLQQVLNEDQPLYQLTYAYSISCLKQVHTCSRENELLMSSII